MQNPKSFTQWIDYFLETFPHMTEEESDFVGDVCKWEDDKRMAFCMAKKIFDERLKKKKRTKKVKK